MVGLSRVAVVGATGCVGRQVCAALSRQGHGVRAIARNPAPHLSHHRFLAADITATDARTLAEVLTAERVDAVVNAAGGWGHTEEEMVYSHVRLVERLVEALTLMKRTPRLVHLGSIHEYGPVAWGTLIDESIETKPLTPYARTKLAGSEVVLRAVREGTVDGIVLRAANMYGPHPPAESFPAALLRRLRKVAATDGVLELSIADAKRDFIDVRDVADAVVRAVRVTKPEPVINVGRGEAMDMRELVALFVTTAGFPLEVMKVQDGPVSSKGGDWTRTEIRLARRVLGWSPTISPRESLRGMWEAADE
ncbi:MAG: NAD-dependent epimerase/dehydratase family protein [Pseudonocardiaceae bacterium]